VGARNTVSIIQRIILATDIHCSVGPSFTCSHAAVCVQSNTLDHICMFNLLSSYLDILQCRIYFNCTSDKF